MNKLLIPEPPLQVLPSLAKAIGLNEAIFLQQLHYLLRNSEATHDGNKWVCLSYDDWRNKHFPFWSIRTLKRIVNSLDTLSLISKTSKYNRCAQDQTRWYSIDYARLNLHIASLCTTNEDAMSNRLLIDEPPLQVLPSLAITIGLNEAIVIQQLHYVSLTNGVFYDNRLWVSTAVEALANRNFPFWFVNTLRRVLHSLSKDNLVFTTTKYNKYNTDRTQSYSVNYDRLTQIINNDSIYTILDNYNEDKDQLVNSRVPTWLLQSANLVTPECQLGHFSECQLGHFSECQLGHFNNKVRDIREEDDDKANVVVVSSDVLPEKTMVGPRTDSTTDSHANDEIADVVAMFDGSPLAGLISPLSIREAVAAYDPSAHPDYQPESPLEGVRRMSSWILKMAAHPDMPVIRTPAGLLISLARRGMDKPAIVARQEASQEKYRMARQRDRYESFVLQLQKEYPGVNVADILATCVGSSYQMPTEEQLAKVREECRQARDRADAARDQAMAKFLRKHSDLKREMRR